MGVGHPAFFARARAFWLVGARFLESWRAASGWLRERRSRHWVSADELLIVSGNHVLCTPFEAEFVVSGGSIKAGAYTQANCGNSDPCDDSNYGEVVIHDITVTHS